MTDESDDLASKARQALSGTRFTTYWLDSLDAVEDAPALETDEDCDLLVVGGGFCGGKRGAGFDPGTGAARRSWREHPLDRCADASEVRRCRGR